MSPATTATQQRPLRLLLVCSDLSDGGGVTRVIANLAHILADMPTLHVDILHAREFKGYRYPMPENVHLVHAGQYARSPTLNLLLNLVRARRGGYDWVVSFWTHENILACLAFLGSGSKLIIAEHFSHGQAAGLISTVRRLIYGAADKLLVLNREEMRYYAGFMKGVELVPNPVLQQLPRVDLGAKQNMVIGVGHLIARKGFMHFVRACVQAGLGKAGWKAVLIGEGPQFDDLKALIASHDATGYIEIVPATRAIEDWYRIAKIIMVPSEAEVFSMVIPESMGHAVVPLAFDVDGPKEILADHPDHLVPIGDTARLGSALKRLVENPALPELGRRFQQEALQRYSLATIGQRWKGLLNVQ